MEQENNFLISDNAVKKINKLLKEEPEGTKFRVSVLGGGCAGFQYSFTLVQDFNPEEDKIFLNEQGGSIIVDEVSLTLLKGSMLDFIETLGSANFEIRNPNAASNCGCGNSFSI